MGMPLFGDKLEYETYKEYARLEVIKKGFKGLIRFTGPVHIPVLVKPHLYIENQFVVWMSLTPMEVMSQKPGLDLAVGNVLVGGLGMGWLTSRILQKPDVDFVTQVEIDPYVLNFFGRPLKEAYPNKLELIKDDVWNYLDKIGTDQFDTIIFDIWPKYSGARVDKKFKVLKKEHPRVWGWGEEGIKNRDRN
jgi:hypothetical protein